MESFSKFLKWLMFERFPNLYRPSQNTYISYDSYRNLSKHIFDESKTFNPKNVKNSDIVFVNGLFLDNFLKTNHLKIDRNYKLLICGENFEINEENSEKLKSKKIIHIFSNNLKIANSNFFTFLPLGIKDKRFLKSGNYKEYHKYKKEKNSNILSVNNRYMPPLNDIFDLNTEKINSNYITHVDPKNYKDFYKIVSHHKFILFSNELLNDSNIFWESIMLDCFPIIKMNNFTEKLLKLNVPALYVKSIEEVEKFDNIFLEKTYLKLKIKQAKNKFLFTNYWRNLINGEKK